MKIVITGSLGNISKPLVEKLMQENHNLVIITNDAEKRNEIESIGATAAIGSLDDTDFLFETFAGAEALYAMIPPNLKEFNSVQHYSKIAESYRNAIIHSGIRRVVHLSSWGAHLDHGTGTILGSHHSEKILRSLENINLTFIRPCSIYYNLFNYIDMIKSAGIIWNNYKNDDKIVWAHPEDIADAVYEELMKSSPEKLNIRYVASDEVTADETAKALGDAIGKPDLKWVYFTDEQVKNNLLQSGVPESFAQNLVDLHSSISSGRMGEDYEKNKPVLGKFKITDFAKEFAAVYNK